MFKTSGKEKKKRSWELVDEDEEQAPSESFLQLQQEMQERDRVLM
jgi:hypothetical protein